MTDSIATQDQRGEASDQNRLVLPAHTGQQQRGEASAPLPCSVFRAFRVDCKPLESGGIYKAQSASKARAMAYAGAHDAGYDCVKFQDLCVRRAPEYDAALPHMKTSHGYGEDYMADLMPNTGDVCD